MIIPTPSGQIAPAWRTQLSRQALLPARVFNRLAFSDLTVVDLRPALAALATRSLAPAADALVRHAMVRAWRTIA